MKKLFAIAILSAFFVASCAQEKEEREEFKEEHNVEKRNAGVPEAAMSDSTDVEDAVEEETD
ncbi:hypothetical protein [Chryseobacterium sp. MP_3.2]|uniref:hypothetical protein n=1 Tax=Chryseobacterium sp. MP_3.2 TaxID=3071712 RepID=UPI002DF98D21|nr:PBP1b-binding outer membrane lipoprotein LpoB [Chryseobacterium sp. MP_3.2]